MFLQLPHNPAMPFFGLSEKFQFVIPKKYREALNLTPGQKMGISIEDGRLILTPGPKMSDLVGLCPHISTEVANDPEEK